MILFVFEGSDDSKIMDTLKKAYPSAISEDVVCLYRNNIYQLYKKMNSSDFTESILSVLQTHLKGDELLKIRGANEDSFSQVFLFFDYEPQHRESDAVDIEILNARLCEMIDFFSDETGNGKLYVSYPMVEALFYTKKLPDNNFKDYVCPLLDAKHFKKTASEFSDYKSHDFLLYSERELQGEKLLRTVVRDNWRMVVDQNLVKANVICTGNESIPLQKMSVSQQSIFENQMEKYVGNGHVAILSAYPLFLFEYLNLEK